MVWERVGEGGRGLGQPNCTTLCRGIQGPKPFASCPPEARPLEVPTGVLFLAPPPPAGPWCCVPRREPVPDLGRRDRPFRAKCKAGCGIPRRVRWSSGPVLCVSWAREVDPASIQRRGTQTQRKRQRCGEVWRVLSTTSEVGNGATRPAGSASPPDMPLEPGRETGSQSLAAPYQSPLSNTRPHHQNSVGTCCVQRVAQ